jgi:hypothetical protein
MLRRWRRPDSGTASGCDAAAKEQFSGANVQADSVGLISPNVSASRTRNSPIGRDESR